MANVKISELPVATSVDVVDTVPLVQGGTTKQATQAALLTTTGNVTAAKLVPTGGTATGNGMYLPATNTLAWSTNGAEGMRLDSSGNLGVGTTSPGAKLDIGGTNNAVFFKNSGATTGYALATVSNTGSVLQYGVSSSTGTFWGSGNAGNYSVNIGTTSAVNFGFGTNDTLRMVLDSSGNLGLGVTPSAWGQGRSFEVFQAGYGVWNGGASSYLLANAYFNSGFKYANTGSAASHYYQFQGQHVWSTAPSGTAGNAISFTQAMTLDASGNFICPGVYNNTTGSAANVFVDSNGVVQRSTSSLRYKIDVQDATHGLAEVMQLRSVTYKGKNDGDTVFGGLIAEEVDAAGLTEFVVYDAEGRPDALHYGNMVSLLTKAIQEQQAIINDLRARVAALEA